MPGINFTVVRGLTEMEAAIHYANSLSTDTRLIIMGHLVNWDAAFSTFDLYRHRLAQFISALHQRIQHFPVPPMIILRTGKFLVSRLC